MVETEMKTIPNQYLKYDFTYESQHHKGKIALNEDTPNLQMMYNHHHLEVTWSKSIKHKGKLVVLNIVVNDDWNDMSKLGKVVASAWVCIYSITDKRHIIDEFEPNSWSYIDNVDSKNNVSKSTFYYER